jgi:hypothetical protein
MLTTGILAEVLVRVLFESGNSKSYLAREMLVPAANEGWHLPH